MHQDYKNQGRNQILKELEPYRVIFKMYYEGFNKHDFLFKSVERRIYHYTKVKP